MRLADVPDRVPYSREALHHQTNAERILADYHAEETVFMIPPNYGGALGACSRADELLAKIMREVR